MGRGDVVVPAPRPGAGGWSCAPERLVGVGIALSPMPVFRRDDQSVTQPERKKERWKGGREFKKKKNERNIRNSMISAGCSKFY